MPYRFTSLWLATIPCLSLAQDPSVQTNSFIDFTLEVAAQQVLKVPTFDLLGIQTRTAQQNAQIIAEVDTYVAQQRAHQARVNALINDGIASSPIIYYEQQGPAIPGRDRFFAAFNQLAEMLKDSASLSLTKAVYLTEAAYDPTLKWSDFQASLQRMTTHIGYLLEHEGAALDDNVAKHMALLRFFSDTLTLDYPNKETPVTSYPLLYDFDDFWGRKDQTKLFVSKLMADGTGQCHSLPLLYLLLAEQMDAEAYLALAPNHSYIKFQDTHGLWYNIELTNHMLTSDQFIQNSGYISAEAIQNQVYMAPLSKKEVVVQCLNDLTIYYQKQYGYEAFVREAAWFAFQLSPKSITPHQLLNNYYYHNLRYVIHQYRKHGLTKAQFAKDSTAQYLKSQLIGSQKYLERVGYRDIPARQYADWLNAVHEEQNKQSHQTKMRTLMGQIDN